jgi:hypothetical protein
VARPAKKAQSRLVVSGTPNLAKSVEHFAVSSVCYICHRRPAFHLRPGVPSYA